MTVNNTSRYKITFKWFLFIVIACVMVTAVRFNRNDYGIAQYTGASPLSDHYEYIAMTQYFRGEDPHRAITMPFSYRPLVPLMASTLPFDAMTALNVVNLMALILTVIVIQLIIAEYQQQAKYKYLLAGLYIFSFPTFYYTTIGLIESPAQLTMALGVYFIIKQHFKSLLLLMFISVFIKETVIMLVACYLAYHYTPKTKYRTLLQTAALLAVYLLASYLSRKFSIDQRLYIWHFELIKFLRNIGKIRTYASVVITIGLPVAIVIYLHINNIRYYNLNNRAIRLVLTGLFLSVALFFYSILTAYADGRPLWYSYLFFILYISIAINKRAGAAAV